MRAAPGTSTDAARPSPPPAAAPTSRHRRRRPRITLLARSRARARTHLAAPASRRLPFVSAPAAAAHCVDEEQHREDRAQARRSTSWGPGAMPARTTTTAVLLGAEDEEELALRAGAGERGSGSDA